MCKIEQATKLLGFFRRALKLNSPFYLFLLRTRLEWNAGHYLTLDIKL